MKKRLPVIAGCFLVLSLLLVGCNKSPPATTPPEKVYGESPPTSPYTLDLSFPDGAPPLNHEAKLTYTVLTSRDLKNLRVNITLPGGLALVSGNLSWQGDMKAGETIEVDTVVKSVKAGNWTMIKSHDLDPAQNGGYMGGSMPYYVSISENSAASGIYPPWQKSEGNTVPIAPAKP